MQAILVACVIFGLNACATPGATEAQLYAYRDKVAAKAQSHYPITDCECGVERGRPYALENVTLTPFSKDFKFKYKYFHLRQRAEVLAKEWSLSPENLKAVRGKVCWSADCESIDYHIAKPKDVTQTWILVTLYGTAHKCTFTDRPNEWTSEPCPDAPEVLPKSDEE